MVKKAERANPKSGEGDPKNSAPGTSVVVGEASSRNKLRVSMLAGRRGKGIIAVVILVAAASLLIWHPWHHTTVPAYSTVDVSDIPHEYDMMTSDQAKAYLYKSTGLTAEDALQKPASRLGLNNYEKALNVAEFLKKFDQDKKALDAYKIAADKNNNAPIAFSQEYALVALQAGNKTVWKQQMEIARDKATRVTTLSAEEKQTLIQQIDRTIKTVEAQP
jgi:hypothetical protein